jgi:hypothetical protein
MDAKTLLATPIAPSPFTVGASPAPLTQEGNGGSNPQSNGDSNPADEKPDFWNYLLVGILIVFYTASFASTYISSNILFYLLGGGGISIPMMGMRIPLAEAVSLMGTGILEGASLGDAYFEHKETLPKRKKILFSAGRGLAFIAQWTLYYMTLGSLLFSTADVNNLSGQDLGTSSAEEAVLVFDPPTPLHGIFVFTISGAWSFANNYVGLDALWVAISRLRRKKKVEGEDEGVLEFFLALLDELKNLIGDYERAKDLETLAMLQRLMIQLTEKMQNSSDLSEVFDQAIFDTINRLPESERKRKFLDKLNKILPQSQLSEKPAAQSFPKPQTPPITPPGWYL